MTVCSILPIKGPALYLLLLERGYNERILTIYGNQCSAILEGTIKSITKFGAFVSLPGGRSGLVHISEIAHSYVANVSDFLSEGQAVKVKVVSIDEAGRINLSIKKATPPPPRPQGSARDRQGRSDFRGGNRTFNAPHTREPRAAAPQPPAPPILRPGSSSSCRPLTAGCPT